MWKSLLIGVKKNNINEYINIDFEKQSDIFGFCDVLSDYIINKYEKSMLMRIINNNYSYLSKIDRTKIYDILNSISETALNTILCKKRKEYVYTRLVEYIRKSNLIVINGFITFRIPEYMFELEELVDNAVCSYLAKKDYLNFIKLLQYFVSMQTPSVRTLHIIAKSDKSYLLIDENENEVTDKTASDFIGEIKNGDINYDDLLISSVIAIAPMRIVIHNKDLIRNTELVNTIQNVFLNRVSLCRNCHLCNKKQTSNSYKE